MAVAGCASSVRSEVPATAPSPTAVPTALPSVTAAPTLSTGGAGSARLVVLADGVKGDVGLWTYGVDGTWTAGAKVPGATAIARDGRRLTIAFRASLEIRDVARPQDLGSPLGVTWPRQAPDGSVACVDRSDSGKTVLAIANADSLTFALVSEQGAASLLSPSPESPFGPSVAWLDTDRIVAVSADARQVPRLAVLDTRKHSTTVLGGLTGVQLLALSPDRLTLAAATETGVYLGAVSDWLAGRDPVEAVGLDSSQVVWDLALSGDGSQLAMLSGTEAADGTVADIRDIGYRRTADGWAKIFDSPAPFTRASGQVWLL